MNHTYYVSFRIAEVGNDDDRRMRLVHLIHGIADGIFWGETTSFILFACEDGADEIAARIKGVINELVDIVVLGRPEFKTMLVIGATEDRDIFKLVPFAREA